MQRPDRDAHAAALRARFRKVSQQIEAPARRQRFGLAMARVMLAAGAGVAAYLALVLLSPWPPLATLGHLASAPGCHWARAVGLAPAIRGNPGYWSSHDGDRDGIACEPHRRSSAASVRYQIIRIR